VIEILNRWTQAVIYHSEDAQAIAGAVALAIRSGANLARANLAGAIGEILRVNCPAVFEDLYSGQEELP